MLSQELTNHLADEFHNTLDPEDAASIVAMFESHDMKAESLIGYARADEIDKWAFYLEHPQQFGTEEDFCKHYGSISRILKWLCEGDEEMTGKVKLLASNIDKVKGKIIAFRGRK